MDKEEKNAWRTAEAWPLKNLEMTGFYFSEGKGGKTVSINNGALTPSSPAVGESFDAYTVNYTTTTGKNSRWTAVNWAREYPDMRSNDARALTYTTSPLTAPVTVIGHPVVHVWLQADAPDLDLFAYLEEVDAHGHSTCITEGNLRASHRTLGQASFEHLGLPWHNHFQSELKPISKGEPVELVFDLLPTAYRFATGNRIRITIACADADNFDTPVTHPAPKLRLLRDRNHPSFIQLPMTPAR
jgi:putative CocE/NonD family hydrolase